MWKYNSPDELYHSGVLGMRWGRRKVKRKSSEDYLNAKKIRKKKISELSNKELQEYNNRKNLEQNYKRLTPAKIAIGLAALGGASVAMENINKFTTQGGTFIKNGKRIVSKMSKIKIPRKV